jgi:hypothetical protein
MLEGGVVNASRAVGFPADGDDGSAAGWERAVDAAVGGAIRELGAAVA